MFRKLAFLFLLLSLWTSVASATQYYVSPSGKDTNTGTSSTSPFLTIQKAAGVVKAGDTVHVAAGTYALSAVQFPISTTVSGTSTARITYISDTKWGAKLTCQAYAGSAAWRNTGDYVDIVNFDISGSCSSGIRNDASFVRVISNHVHHLTTECGSNGGAGIVHTWQFNGVNNDVIGNVVDHLGTGYGGQLTCTPAQDNGTGIYIQGNGGNVYNNIVNNTGKNGIQLWHAAQHINIANNVSFHNTRSGIEVGDGDNPGNVTADYVIVVNNVTMYNGYDGVEETGLTGTNNVYKNNEVYGNTRNVYNLQNGNTASGGLTLNPTTGMFVNWQIDGSGDYSLVAGSPLIDKGVSTSAPTYDFNNTTRPVGTAWDIGAYEFVPASVPVITCTSPTSGTSYVSPVHFACSATNSAGGIGNWHIYVDGADVWSTTTKPTSISTDLSMAAGSHTVVVKVWDSNGANPGSTSMNITVAAATTVTVSISSPTNNATVQSPIHVVASATTNSGSITGWHIYLDGVDMWSTPGPTASIVQDITASATGTHTLMVRAWNSGGTYGDASETVNVASSTTTTSSADWSIAMLPDTQFYSSGGCGYSSCTVNGSAAMFNSQTNWIVNNRTAKNIQLVVGVGDIVNGYGNGNEWTVADAAYGILDKNAPDLPYYATIGNHDYDVATGNRGSLTNFNKYFGPARYSGKPWYTNSYTAGSNENFYGFITVNGQTYLVICLEFYPRQVVLDWAGNLITSNPDKRVIISTHAYGYFDGDAGQNYRTSECDNQDPSNYNLLADNDGDEMFAFFKKYRNVWLILSGHQIRGGNQEAVGRRMDYGDNGNLIMQIYADYQNLDGGGNGYMRLLTIHPSTNTVDVTSFSPYLNQSFTNTDDQFTWPTVTAGVTKTGTGAVMGRVKDTSCNAISGATVTWKNGSTTTDSGGNYRITGMPPGTWDIQIKKSGFLTSTRVVQVDNGLTASNKVLMTAGTDPTTPAAPGGTANGGGSQGGGDLGTSSSGGGSTGGGGGTTPAATVPPHNHVVFVALENHSYTDTYNATNMPWLTNLANTYGVATQFYATAHPSIGNYFEVMGGANPSGNSDGYCGGTTTATCFSTDNFLRRLIAAGKSWKVYSEGLPSTGYIGGDSGTYVKHHNPFAYFSDILSGTTANGIVDFSNFSTDLTNKTLPNFSFVQPNNQDNGHNCTDGTTNCSSAAKLPAADTWLSANIQSFLNSCYFTGNGCAADGMLVIWVDESDTTDTAHGGGHVEVVIAAPDSISAKKSTTLYLHQNLLRTLLENFSITTYPGDASTATPTMAEFFQAPANTTGGGTGGGTTNVSLNWTTSVTAETKNNTAASDKWKGMYYNLGFGMGNNVPAAANTSRVSVHTLLYSGHTTLFLTHDTPWWSSGDDMSHKVASDTLAGSNSCTVYSSYPQSGTASNGFKPCMSHMDIGVSDELAYQAQRKVDDMRGRGLDGVFTDWYGKGSREDNATLRYRDIADKLGFRSDGKTPVFAVSAQIDGGAYSACASGLTTSSCKDIASMGGTNFTGSNGASSSNSNCGGLGSGTTAGTDKKKCYVTKHAIALIWYLNTTYWTHTSALKYNGRPILTWFDHSADIDQAFMDAFTGSLGNPMHIWRQTPAFSYASSSGAFNWIGLDSTPFDTNYDEVISYDNSFYNSHKTSNSAKIAVGAFWTGFNNRAASWACSTYPNCEKSLGHTSDAGDFKITGANCGSTILDSIQAANAYYSSSFQLQYLSNNTWTDYEEGSATEPGVDNCWQMPAPTVSSGVLRWTLTGYDPDGAGSYPNGGPDDATKASLKTVHHFTVFISDGTAAADGSERLAVLADNIAATEDTPGCKCFSLNLSQFNVPTGTYHAYVKLQSQPFIHNTWSSNYATFNAVGAANQPPSARLTVSPPSGTAPLNVTADTSQSVDPDGTISQRVISWGDGTSDTTLSGGNVSALHTYSASGVYYPSLTVTDSFGATATASATVTVGQQGAATALMAVDPTSGTAPFTANVDTSASQPSPGASITNRTIQWGDGTSNLLSSGTVTSHTYSAVGNFPITLTITDSAGKSAQTSQTVSVLAPGTTNSITIDTLEDNAYVFSPLRVRATAAAAVGPVQDVQIFVDGVQVEDMPFSDGRNPALIDKYIFVTVGGWHDVMVQAYDGNYTTFTKTVHVFAEGTNQ